MKNTKIKVIKYILKNVVVMFLLLTFILPYYVAATNTTNTENTTNTTNTTTTTTSNEEEQEKGRGAVPTAAGLVLEGITIVTDADKVTSSSSSSVSTNYPESGDGYNSLTEVNGTKYKNYKQFLGSYAGEAYWDGTMANSACGPTSVAIVASSYGIDKSPLDIANMLSYTGPSVLSEVMTKIGISNECKSNSNNSTTVNDIRQNLEQGRPVLVGVGAGPDSKYTSGGHWMVLLSISGDTITISNPGSNEDDQKDDINSFVSNYLSSYILVTQSPPTNSSSSSTTSGTGNVVSESSVTSDGYTGIYKSGTTGKEFKEYKQNGNAPWSYEYYANGGTIGDSGCCLVADCILCSGYGQDINPSELNSNCGGSYTVGQGIGYVDYFSSASNSEVISHLKSGGTLMAYTHSAPYTNSQHYMAVIDVSSDGTQVYVSNPNYNGPTGWIDANSFLSAMESYLFIPAGGGSGSYGGASSGITSLDNFLFIGDSGVALAESEIKALGNNITVLGVSGSTPGNWTGVTTAGKTYNIGSTVGSYNKNVTLPAQGDVKGVCVTLGANGLTSETSNMKKVLDNLLSAYPDTPIFATSILHMGTGYTVMSYTAYNDEADEYNNEIKAYCDSKSNLYYIDVSSGLYDNGILKPEYEDDMELTSAGNEIFAQNIKNAILNSGANSTSGNLVGLTSNIAQYIVPNGRGGYKIDIDLDAKVQEMLELLENNNIKDVDNFLKTGKKEEYLKQMLKAELVTQFPDLRSAEELKLTNKEEQALKDVKENLPGVIENLEIIHVQDVVDNKGDVSSKEYTSAEELNTELTSKLNQLTSNNISYTNQGNNVYTYTQNGVQFGIEKTSDTTLETYKIIELKNSEEMENYIFDSLKKENVQTKIENLLTNGSITRDAVHSSFFTTINSKAELSGYDANTMESLYFSYIKKIYDNLTASSSSIADLFLKLFATETPEDELQGVIRIKRKAININTNEEEDPYFLSYIPYDEFKEMCNNNDTTALDHFTIDSSGGIIVAQWKMDTSFPGTIVSTDSTIDAYEQYKSYMVDFAADYQITSSSTISYLSQIYQHTMPFDLLWTLLVYGGDYNFIYDLTNLIFDTDITITALDKITETTKVYTDTYTIGTQSEDTAITSAGTVSTTSDTGSSIVTVQYTMYNTTCTSELKISYINSWIAKYINNSEVLNEPEVNESQQHLQNNDAVTDWEQTGTEPLSDDDAFNVVLTKNIKNYLTDYKNSSVDSYTLTRAKQAILFEGDLINSYINFLKSGNFVVFPSDKLNGVTRNSSYLFTKQDITGTSTNSIGIQTKPSANLLQSEIDSVVNNNTNDVSERTKLKDAINEILVGIYRTGDWNPQISGGITTNYSRVESAESDVKTKTTTYGFSSTSGQIIEKTDPNSDEDNFITLLNKNGRAKGSLRSIAEWMFESIESNRILCDKLDLMKYLLGIAYGRNYDVDESFSFNMFDPENFKTSSSGEMNGKVSTNLEEFLISMEGGDEYINGDEYIVYDIGDGCLNIGHGIVVGNSDGTPWYPDILPNIYAGQIVSKEIYDKIYQTVMKGFTDALDSALAKYDVTLKQYQYDAMVSFIYNCGASSADTIVAAYKNGGDEGYWNETSQWINRGSPFEYGLSRRRAEEYELFTKGDYNYDPDF